MGFWKCFNFLVFTGIIAFPAGRLLPKRLFHADRFPFRAYRWERGGKIYDKLHIRAWHKKVPDMSRIFPYLIPPKRVTGDINKQLPRMLQETCIAEFVHFVLCLVGLRCLWLWPGAGGVIVTILYIGLFNLPFIIIQRYERPRLLRLYKKMQKEPV